MDPNLVAAFCYLRGCELRKFSRMSFGRAEENENAHGQPRFALLRCAELVGFDPDQNGSLRVPLTTIFLERAALATVARPSIIVATPYAGGRGWAPMSSRRQ